MKPPATLMAFGLLLAASGCAALESDMRQAETAYDQARYDEALIWFDDLEDDAPDMKLEMRTRFYYLRGMTAYRLDKRDDALHYLALARELAGPDAGGSLQGERRQTMERILAELTPQDGSFRARTGSGEGSASQTAAPVAD